MACPGILPPGPRHRSSLGNEIYDVLLPALVCVPGHVADVEPADRFLRPVFARAAGIHRPERVHGGGGDPLLRSLDLVEPPAGRGVECCFCRFHVSFHLQGHGDLLRHHHPDLPRVHAAAVQQFGVPPICAGDVHQTPASHFHHGDLLRRFCHRGRRGGAGLSHPALQSGPGPDGHAGQRRGGEHHGGARPSGPRSSVSCSRPWSRDSQGPFTTFSWFSFSPTRPFPSAGP